MCPPRRSLAPWHVPDGVSHGLVPPATALMRRDDRWLLALYQLATWMTFSVLDDAAMLAFAFS